MPPPPLRKITMDMIKMILLSFGILLFGSIVLVFVFGGATAVLVVLYYIVMRLT